MCLFYGLFLFVLLFSYEFMFGLCGRASNEKIDNQSLTGTNSNTKRENKLTMNVFLCTGRARVRCKWGWRGGGGGG